MTVESEREGHASVCKFQTDKDAAALKIALRLDVKIRFNDSTIRYQELPATEGDSRLHSETLFFTEAGLNMILINTCALPKAHFRGLSLAP